MTKQQPEEAAPKDSPSSDAFALERAFPSVDQLFESHAEISAANETVLIAIDTNALLLPYSFKAGNLQALEDVYKKLASQSRLFLPDRVVREFTRLRDQKLSEIVQGLENRRGEGLSAEMPPILESTQSFSLVTDSRAKLDKAKQTYGKAIGNLIDEIKKWRGDDPIVKMYSEVFHASNIETLPYDDEAKKQYQADWKWRSDNKLPPGYKDQGKSDTGIGDYLVWIAILRLGEKQKKDLAFVTGEQKADWFVRSGNSGIYPRPELLAEYRAHSDGRSLRLLTLYELLSEMKAPATVVEEVKQIEQTANTAISIANSLEKSGAFGSETKFFGKKTFDYSTNDGKIEISGAGTSFILRFSKASDEAIHFYRDGTNLTHVGRIKDATGGQQVTLDEYDTSSRAYTIRTGERFIARNNQGRILIGRILRILDDSRGGVRDEVAFMYTINSVPDGPAVAP